MGRKSSDVRVDPFLQKLRAIDPRSREEREAERNAAAEVNRRAAQPVLADLAKVGFRLESIAGLQQVREPYPEAVPVLMKWVALVSNRDVKEDLVRALSVPWAKPDVLPLFLAEFRRCDDDDGLRWAIGNGLEILADATVAEPLLEMAADRRYGKARQMLVLALGKVRDPRAVETLITLLDDRDVAIPAIMALGRIGSKAVRANLETFLGDRDSDFRREAKRALAKIDKRGQ